MMRRQTCRLVLMCLVVLAVALPSALLPAGSAAAAAEASCPPSTELAYDDGKVMNYVSTTCPSCSDVQGVRFSLPEGLSSATITSVRFWCRPASPGASVEVWILRADRETDLVPHIAHAVGGTGWQTVGGGGAVASGDFYVFVRRLEKDTSLGCDYWNDASRSFVGEHPSTAKEWEGNHGDIMVRATIEASVHVGAGQQYSTIQAAIDGACSGLTIYVHPGTYNENVTVWKTVTLTSTEGAGQTIVQSPSGRRNTFTVKASGVSLSGFTIKNATDSDRAGVSLENASRCVISGNVILNNDLGVHISEESGKNIIVENEFRSNYTGVYVDGSQNYVSGNDIHGNTAPLGSAVFLSATASGNQLRFNSITIDAGLAAGACVYNQNTAEDASCTQNWWGDASGPSNVGGQGPPVGEGVVFDPWLVAAPQGVKMVAAGTGAFTVAARDEASATVLGECSVGPVISVVGFAANPGGEFPTTPMGKWVDVFFSDDSGVESVEIRVYYTAREKGDLDEESLRLYWWDSTKWTRCSESGVDKANGFVWAKLDGEGMPSLADLQGTFFAVGTSGGGGMSWWLIPVAILILAVLLIAFRVFWVLTVKNGRKL